MANTKVPVELSSTPSIVDNGNATAITIDSSENSTFSGNINLDLATPTVIFKESGAAKFFIGESSAVGGGSGYYDLYAAGGLGQRFFTGAAERMRIDANGTITQTTSSASPVSANFVTGNSNCDITMNSANTSSVTRLRNGTNDFQIHTNGAERMRIDSSGKVGIGESSPSKLLHLTSNTDYEGMLIKGAGHKQFQIESTQSSKQVLTTYISGSANYSIGIDTDNAFIFRDGVPNTERMRIDSSGRLMVNQTSASAASAGVKMQVASDMLTTGSLAGYFWENRSGMTIASGSGWGGWYSTGTASHFLYSDGANRASIGRTSGTYTALSDVNKKKDFEDSTVGLAEVMQLKPKKFRMLEDADDAPKKLGFIAQDVENVIPEAYVEDLADDENEETFIGLTDRPIIAALTKAIQEQQELINNLTARIEQLEN